MKRDKPMDLMLSNSIIYVLKKKICLSTSSLFGQAILVAGYTDWSVTDDALARKVYRIACRMERRGTLVSAKVYNGKNYERVWRLK